MARYLKQSTAATVVLGPFLDDTDGKTAETALTISAADVLLSKNGAAFAAANAAATHMTNGYYSDVLSTGNTDTLGRLVIIVSESGALPVRHDYIVLDANTYDSLIGGTDKLQIDAVQLLGTAYATPTVAGIQEVDVTHWIGTAAATPTVAGVPEVDVTHWLGTASATPTVAGVPEVDVTHAGGTALNRHVGTASAVTATTITLDASLASNEDDVYNGAEITILSATSGAQQTVIVTDYVGITRVATIDAWPAGTPTGAIGYELNNDAQNAATVNANVVSIAAGAITAAAIAANAIDADALAADAGTEIGTAVWATATRLLTAGTNIALAKGTGVTGFNDLSAAQVNAEADTAIADAALATAANLATANTRLTTIVKFLLNRLVVEGDGTITLYDDDETTPLYTWAATDVGGDLTIGEAA